MVVVASSDICSLFEGGGSLQECPSTMPQCLGLLSLVFLSSQKYISFRDRQLENGWSTPLTFGVTLLGTPSSLLFGTWKLGFRILFLPSLYCSILPLGMPFFFYNLRFSFLQLCILIICVFLILYFVTLYFDNLFIPNFVF